MAAAGWYRNPDGSGGERYWDGIAWTSDTRVSPVPPEPASGGRVARGFRLTGAGLRVIGEQPALIGVVLVGMAAFAAISVGLLFAVFGRLPSGHDFVFPRYLLAMPIVGVGSIASTYANFVVTVAADRRLRGNPIPVRKALGVANRRMRPLLAWWALSLVVGLFLQVLAERIKVAGPIARWLLGLAWGLATTFVLPLLVLEDVTVGDAVRRSASLFKAKWGEKVTADAALGLPALVVMLPLAVIVGVVALSSPGLAIVLGAVLFALLISVTGAAGAAVTVAVYHYAAEGWLAPGFSAADLERRYRRR